MTMTYVERFAGLVAEITGNVKARKSNEDLRFVYAGLTYDLADRTQRMALIERVADDYVSAHADVNQRAIDAWIERGCKGERPSPVSLDTALIDRLADAVLNEELTDPDPYKIAHNEYPFMSDWQMDLRHDRETSLKAVEETGTDGRDYRLPKRRRRNSYENNFVDSRAKIRNVERAAQYKRDTAAGEVVTYNLRENGGELAPDFVTAATTAETWRDHVSLVY